MHFCPISKTKVLRAWLATWDTNINGGLEISNIAASDQAEYCTRKVCWLAIWEEVLSRVGQPVAKGLILVTLSELAIRRMSQRLMSRQLLLVVCDMVHAFHVPCRP